MGDIKVFISSVQREFERERRQLCDYIRTDALLSQFFVPFIFEDLPASEISAQKAYLTQAAACHIYLGIFGRLPDGFTVQKLREIHSSEPTNPVIAHPLFLTGYIEHLGTGTTDMIADCEEYGLRAPEFIQAKDFRTIIYRKEKESEHDKKVSTPGEIVTELEGKVIEQAAKSNRAEQKSNSVRLTAKQQKVLEFCNEMPRTAQEILEMVGVKYQTRTLQQYVTKLVLAGVLRPTTTHKNDSNRKYITAHDEE